MLQQIMLQVVFHLLVEEYIKTFAPPNFFK